MLDTAKVASSESVIMQHDVCRVARDINRRYAHSITRTKNDQLSVDGAKLDGNLKAEVPYKSMGSKCGSSNNSPLEAISLAIHFFCTERSVWQARWPVLSSSGELLLEPHLLPILLYGTSAFKFSLVPRPLFSFCVGAEKKKGGLGTRLF